MKGTAVAMRLTDVLIKVLDRAPGQVKGNAVNYAMASLKGVRGYGDGFAMDYLYVRVDGFANSPMPFVYMDGVAALCAHYASEKRQAMLLVRLLHMGVAMLEEDTPDDGDDAQVGEDELDQPVSLLLAAAKAQCNSSMQMWPGYVR